MIANGTMDECLLRHLRWMWGCGTSLRYLCIRYSLVLLFAGSIQQSGATEGPLMELYRGFLENGNPDVFVAVAKQRIFPQVNGEERDIILPGGAKGRFKPPLLRSYISFGHRGPYFIVATSPKHSLLKPDDLVSADTIMGLDEAGYWIFDLNKPIQLFQAGADGQLMGEPFQMFNRLTLFPLAEAMREQGIYQGDITLAGLLANMAEGIMIAQFGYNRKLSKPPTRGNSQLRLSPEKGPTRLVRVVGDVAAPSALVYKQPTDSITAALDYASNSLEFKKTVGSELVSIVHYQVLAVERMQPEHDRLFSWKFYREQDGVGEVMATVRTNGATARAELQEDGTFATGDIIGKAIRTGLESKSPPGWTPLILLVLVGIGIALPLFARFRGRTQDQTKG